MQTPKVIQDAIVNNGAILEGTVVSVEESCLPCGLWISRNNLFVADSSDDGGLMQIELSNNRRTILLSNGSPNCQRIHGVAAKENGGIVFTDRDARKVCLWHEGHVSCVAGSGARSSKDGSSKSSSFEQPTAVCMEGNAIYVANTYAYVLCVVTPISSLSLYLKQTDTVCKTFSIHLPGVLPNICTISQAIEAFREVSSLLQSWEREAAESLGRMGTVQGP